jgi:pyridinium-3,5-biscarboxylic acid mononucleotide sulfurtransferase
LISDATLEDRERLTRLRERLRELGAVVVAYSGGVDSSFLAWVAHQELGAKALMVLALSPAVPEEDRVRAVELAQEQGWNYRLVHTDELEDENYRANGGDRCFYCKNELFSKLAPLAEGRPVLYGAMRDDLDDHRPGARAAELHGVQAPLQEVGLGKVAIRRLSRVLGVPTWDLPSSPCLASRIAYGERVDAAKLRMVEQAEAGLRGLGLREFRVRHHGVVARLEIPPEEWAAFLQRREDALSVVRGAGFLYVTLDLAGFRSGSLNQMLATHAAP